MLDARRSHAPAPSLGEALPAAPSRRRRPRSPPFLLLFVGRSLWLTLTSIRFLLELAIRRPFDRKVGPDLLRRYLEACGAGFVKLGQLLAMRYDLLPERYCFGLAALLDDLAPLPAETVTAVIEADLQRPLREVFPTFSAVALSSASIAQVHRARLPDGTEVVVKVKKPGVEARIRVDLLLLRFAAYLVDSLGLARELNLRRVVRVVAASVASELDFEREARNTQAMHDALARDHINHRAPLVHEQLCGRNVITMEDLEGVPLKDLIQALRAGGDAGLASHVDPDALALLVFRSMLEQFFHHGLFHADPHPANLLLLKSGGLGLVDFGMIGILDDRTRIQQFRLRECIAQGDADGAFHVLLNSLEPIPRGDLWQFESEFRDIVADWVAAVSSDSAPLRHRSSGYFIQRLFRAMRRAHISIPVSVVQLYRSILIADAVMLALSPRVNWVPELSNFVRDERRRRLKELWVRLTSGEGLGSVATTGLLARSAVDKSLAWISYRLPALSRQYQDVLGQGERMLVVALSYTRALCWCVALVCIGLELMGWPAQVVPEPLGGLRLWGYWVAGAAVVGALLTGAMRNSLLDQAARSVAAPD
ncbi:MAG TPA: AarF/UbiB family protein [Myxococcaceae bacterium]|nr:AarF/UbiB family protein [Myxococcaceae bacterium]